MKLNLTIECYSYEEAQELFKALSGMPKSIGDNLSTLKNEEWAKKRYSECLTPDVGVVDTTATLKTDAGPAGIDPETYTIIVEGLKEVKAEADKATTGTIVDTPKRQRPSRAKVVETAIKADEQAHGTFVLTNEPSIPLSAQGTAADEPAPAKKTIEDVRILAKALMGKGHNAVLQAEMAKLGATRLSEIKDYDTAYGVLDALSRKLGV